MILMKILILILILIFAAVSLNTMASNPVHVIILPDSLIPMDELLMKICRHILKHWLRTH